MQFIPLYFADRLRIINPHGDVGIVTLWARVDAVERVITEACGGMPDRVAVIGNLYGGGLNELIRNLLYNPQIRHLLIVGPDLSGSGTELHCLFSNGLIADGDRYLIDGTNRRIAGGFREDCLFGVSTYYAAGKLTSGDNLDAIRLFFGRLKPQVGPTRGRIEAPMPTYVPDFMPSNPIGHQIVARRPLDVWEQVVHRLDRFGVPVELEGGKKRKELLNLKVVVTEPVQEPSDQLAARGFDITEFERYQRDILDGSPPPDGVEYTYGNRLRDRKRDMLFWASEKLKENPNSRDTFASVWDNYSDGDDGFSSPCLVSIFFRLHAGALTMTATYRVHNAMDAWLKNFYGLMAIQKFVCDGAGLPPGPITVISHSISINLDYSGDPGLIPAIVSDIRPDSDVRTDDGKIALAEDPCGAFIISIDHDTGTIIADLTQDGDLLTRYTGRTAADVERQIARDRSVSLISHAMYVGRELARAEMRLKSTTRE